MCKEVLETCGRSQGFLLAGLDEFLKGLLVTK